MSALFYVMLDIKQKEIIRARIEKKLSRMIEKIADLEEMTKPIGPENAIGRISRMDAINNKSVMEAALRTARKELHDLEYANKNIDKEEYGYCLKCKKEINLKRLMLMPGSKHCISCAS